MMTPLKNWYPPFKRTPSKYEAAWEELEAIERETYGDNSFFRLQENLQAARIADGPDESDLKWRDWNSKNSLACLRTSDMLVIALRRSVCQRVKRLGGFNQTFHLEYSSVPTAESPGSTLVLVVTYPVSIELPHRVEELPLSHGGSHPSAENRGEGRRMGSGRQSWIRRRWVGVLELGSHAVAIYFLWLVPVIQEALPYLLKRMQFWSWLAVAGC